LQRLDVLLRQRHRRALRPALRALARVGISECAWQRASTLSGGQQQRAAIARAIVTDPALILADEPSGNLDSASSQEVLQIFSRLNVTGRTVIIITHEADVAAHAKRVIRLSDGWVVSDTRQSPLAALPPRFVPGDLTVEASA